MARKIYNRKIVDSEFPNVGIAIEDGKKIKIKGAIQGQKVETVSRRKAGENYSEKLYSLLEESSLEKTVGCIHMKDCGGCVYQALKYEDEFLYKSRQIEKLFENFGVDIQKIKAKCEKFYRNKMEYTFGDEYKGSELALGMHKKNRFYEIVNTENCQIVHEDFNLIQVAVRNYFRKIGLSFLHKRTGEGNLRHLVIRRSSLGEILINLVVTSDTDIDREEFIKMLLGLKLEGKIESVFLTRNDSVADAVIPEKVELIYGREYIFEEIFDLKFKITPFSFFQTNTESAEILYKTAIGFLENLEEKTVFDLYSGVGTISQIIAKKAKFVIGIEIVEEAIESAKNSAKFNGIENVEFIAGDVLKKIDEIDLTPDVIILDPPREGINPKALKKITEISPENILYISCNPKTLARDLQDFLKTGYKIEKMAMIDQFPKTANVESVALLSKLQTEHHLDIEIGKDELQEIEFNKKATYEEIKEYVLEKYGLKVSNLYIAQVKSKYSLKERLNYNKSKKSDNRSLICPEIKEKAIEDAFKYFGMI